MASGSLSVARAEKWTDKMSAKQYSIGNFVAMRDQIPVFISSFRLENGHGISFANSLEVKTISKK
jgi:hypothetical protein